MHNQNTGIFHTLIIDTKFWQLLIRTSWQKTLKSYMFCFPTLMLFYSSEHTQNWKTITDMEILVHSDVSNSNTDFALVEAYLAIWNICIEVLPS